MQSRIGFSRFREGPRLFRKIIGTLNLLEAADSLNNDHFGEIDIRDLALWIIARDSDNPTVQSSLETLRVTTTIAEADGVKSVQKWLSVTGNARSINHSLIILLMRRLTTMRVLAFFQSLMLAIVGIMLLVELH